MSKSDGSVEQASDGDLDEATAAHLKASGGSVDGQPETGISRPIQPPAITTPPSK